MMEGKQKHTRTANTSSAAVADVFHATVVLPPVALTHEKIIMFSEKGIQAIPKSSAQPLVWAPRHSPQIKNVRSSSTQTTSTVHVLRVLPPLLAPEVSVAVATTVPASTAI